MSSHFPVAWRLRMPLYLGRFSYTTDAMKALLSQPQDRSAAAREVAESLGGELLGFWYAHGVSAFSRRLASDHATVDLGQPQA